MMSELEMQQPTMEVPGVFVESFEVGNTYEWLGDVSGRNYTIESIQKFEEQHQQLLLWRRNDGDSQYAVLPSEGFIAGLSKVERTKAELN